MKRTDHPQESAAEDDALEERSVPASDVSFPIVGIGASAGGLEAFMQLLKALPLDTGMGFVLVQHLDPEHESALTQILSRATSLPVSDIREHQRVEPNHVYVIPPDTSLGIEQGFLKLTPRQRTRAPHRPIDAFFESLAQDQGERAIGVVLSGTASDGTLGLEAIKAEGGITFAQNDSAKHDSMPRSAVAAGCVDLVLSPAEIARELARIAKHPYAAKPLRDFPSSPEEDRAQATAHEDDDTPLPSGGSPGEKHSPAIKIPRKGGKLSRPAAVRRGKDAPSAVETDGAQEGENGYKTILWLLRNHSGVDFSLYRSSTIQRRINRRVILTKHNTLADYAGFLRDNSKELDALYSDVLISVTSFFRNPEMFDALQHKVLPELLKQPDDPLRCWVLGCSTGQEAYSIAMSFVEAADKAPSQRRLQIFATDLNNALLEKARSGLYAKSLADDIAPERLRRFFVEEEAGYRVNKLLREMVVFARQNLISDPPFSRMDLISCRNLLIYLEPTLQKRALPTFHYALKPGGFLLLGASESIGGFTELFEPVDKKYKIYSKKRSPTPQLHLPLKREPGQYASVGALPMPQRDPPKSPQGINVELSAQREADRITLNHFAPPGVLVNDELQVLQFRGATGAFLEPPSGKASFDVLKMAREGLVLPLRATLKKARKENKPASKENVRVERNAQSRRVNLHVIPLKNLREPCYLILFEEADGSERVSRLQQRAPIGKGEERSRIDELETQLAETREYFQSMQDQHEASNEELQSANEEVQSANEELQSVNEELETSKEELESANEELTTVNEEVSNRNIELDRLNNDLLNLQSSTRLAIVLLGRDLTIRRFSPEAKKMLDLLPTDVGRPIGHIRHNLVSINRLLAPESTPGSNVEGAESPVDLESIAAETIASIREQECEVRDRAGRWHSLRLRPYVTLDGKMDGVVMVLVDIDAIKQHEQVVAAARDYAEATIATVREPLLVLDNELRVEYANESFYRTFGVKPHETIGRVLYELGNGQWEIAWLRELLEEVIQRRTTLEGFLVEHEFENIGKKVMLLNARRIANLQPKGGRILLAIEDITERKRAEESAALQSAIVTFSEDAIISENLDGVITSWNKGAEHVFGHTAEEIIGKPVTLLIPEDRRDEEPRILGSIRRGEAIEHYRTVRKRKDGSLRDISLTVSPLKDPTGAIIGASKIARDITEQLEMEREIKLQAKQLADESRRKDEFLAMLSHELRNPLAPIRSAVHLLRMQERGSESAIQQQAREIIERQVSNLTKLVSDLLEVSRVVSGRIRLNLQAVDLNQIVQHAMETATPLINQHKHELISNLSSKPLWINADPTRMEEVFVNLLSNAAKYTTDGGRIEVSCEPSREESSALVKVRDNGIGIDHELLPRIFDLFTQADRTLARSAGGLGIGLSLAHRLVDLHGGTIEAQSPAAGSDVGCEFIVKLPLMEALSELPLREAPTAEKLQDPEGMRVVVIDDNIDLVIMLTTSLRMKGYSVQSAHNGPEGLELIRHWRPDVVLLDIGLPGLDGYEVARRLRSEPTRGDGETPMRLIAVTGYGREIDIALASEAGFDAHLIKPYEFDELERLIGRRTDKMDS